MMTDTVEFKVALLRAKMTMEELADAIGVSPATLSYKVNNRRVFTSVEIKAIVDALHLTMEDRDKIFFADQVDEKST